MTVRALFSMGVNVLGGIYIYISRSTLQNAPGVRMVRYVSCIVAPARA